MEWGHVCLTVNFPCPGGNQVLTTLTTSSTDSTSFRRQHLSGVWRDAILKVLSQGCRLDAVTLSIRVVLWLPKWCCWCEALRYTEAAFHACSCLAKYIGNISIFLSACWYTCLSWLLFLSASRQGESLLHSPSTLWPSCFWLMENVMELRFSYFFIPRSFLSSDLQYSCQLQRCHKHCWAIYECSSPFLLLQQGTLITAFCL